MVNGRNGGDGNHTDHTHEVVVVWFLGDLGRSVSFNKRIIYAWSIHNCRWSTCTQKLASNGYQLHGWEPVNPGI